MATISTITNKLDVIFSGNACDSGYIQFSAQQGDIKSRLVEASLFLKTSSASCKDGRQAFDASGKNVVIVYEFTDENGAVKITPEISCQVNGSKVQFTIPNAPLLNAGIVTAQLKVYDTASSGLLHSALFMFEVLRTLGIGNIEDDNVPVLIQLINDVNALKTSVTQSIADANSAAQSANDAANAATAAANLVPNQILTEAQQATQNLGQAISDANAAALNANNAAQTAQQAAQNLDANLDGKVDKIAGKGLSTNDYTDEDKASVGQIASKAPLLHRHDNYVTQDQLSGIGGSLDYKTATLLQDGWTQEGTEYVQIVNVSGLSSNKTAIVDIAFNTGVQQVVLDDFQKIYKAIRSGDGIKFFATTAIANVIPLKMLVADGNSESMFLMRYSNHEKAQNILLPSYSGTVFQTLKQVYGTITVATDVITMSYSHSSVSSMSGFYTTVDITNYSTLEFALQVDEITTNPGLVPYVGVFNKTPNNGDATVSQFMAFAQVLVSPSVTNYPIDISNINGNRIIGMLGGTKGRCVGIVLRR